MDSQTVSTMPTPRIAVILDSRDLKVGDINAHTFKFDINKLQSGKRLSVDAVSAFIPYGCMNGNGIVLTVELFDGSVTTLRDIVFQGWASCVDYTSLLTELNAKSAGLITWSYKYNSFFDGGQYTRQLVATNISGQQLTMQADSPFITKNVGIHAYHEPEDIIIEDGESHTFSIAPFVASESYYFVCSELARTNRGFAVGDSVPPSTIAMINGISYDNPLDPSIPYSQNNFFILNYSTDSTSRELTITVKDKNNQDVTILPGMGPLTFILYLTCHAE